MAGPANQTFPLPIPIRVRKSCIQAAAEAYAHKSGLVPGFSIESSVESLGGRIEYGSRIRSSNESSCVYGYGDFVLYIRTDTSPLHNRFTISHQLGHYLLHYPMVVARHGPETGMIATRFIDETDPDLVRTEWEADWFAAGPIDA